MVINDNLVIFIHSSIIIIMYSCVTVKSTYLFNFYLFENFELTKDIFIKEQNIMKELGDMRVALYDKQNHIAQIAHGCTILSTKNDAIGKMLKDAFILSTNFQRFILSDLLQTLRYYDGNNASDTKYAFPFGTIKKKNTEHTMLASAHFDNNVPLDDIVGGASRGLLFIYETYDLNIKEFSKGYLGTGDVAVNNSRHVDSLHPDDLASMATIAMRMHWYDTSIEYLKEAINLFYSLTKLQIKHTGLPASFESMVLQMRMDMAEYHNMLLLKKQNHIGSDWKLFPYLVNEGNVTTSQISCTKLSTIL